MQWDEGAFKEYEDKKDNDAVGDCLLRQHSLGLSNTACLSEYLRMLGTANDLNIYFEYEKQPATSNPQTDACIVFTGPAQHNSAIISNKFLPCITSYHPETPKSCADLLSTSPQNTCTIPHMIWSGGSKNNVPVAHNHVVSDATAAGMDALAVAYFLEAQKEATCALGKITDYVNKNLEVVLFSGEGDSLHQMFDCIVQGPYARVDLWSRGSMSQLPVPNWARDTGGQGRSRYVLSSCLFV
jgi:hypothetical protein